MARGLLPYWAGTLPRWASDGRLKGASDFEGGTGQETHFPTFAPLCQPARRFLCHPCARLVSARHRLPYGFDVSRPLAANAGLGSTTTGHRLRARLPQRASIIPRAVSTCAAYAVILDIRTTPHHPQGQTLRRQPPLQCRRVRIAPFPALFAPLVRSCSSPVQIHSAPSLLKVWKDREA